MSLRETISQAKSHMMQTKRRSQDSETETPKIGSWCGTQIHSLMVPAVQLNEVVRFTPANYRRCGSAGASSGSESSRPPGGGTAALSRTRWNKTSSRIRGGLANLDFPRGYSSPSMGRSRSPSPDSPSPREHFPLEIIQKKEVRYNK